MESPLKMCMPYSCSYQDIRRSVWSLNTTNLKTKHIVMPGIVNRELRYLWFMRGGQSPKSPTNGGDLENLMGSVFSRT
jgi:hypothetical protein